MSVEILLFKPNYTSMLYNLDLDDPLLGVCLLLLRVLELQTMTHYSICVSSFSLHFSFETELKECPPNVVIFLLSKGFYGEQTPVLGPM